MYSSDLTDVQWARLKHLLERTRRDGHAGGRPRKYELRHVVDALLYVVKTGCQWRQLPDNFPLWLSVHQQLRAGHDDGTWERVNQTLREQGRRSVAGTPRPSPIRRPRDSAKKGQRG